jgi:hypothetical protein
MRTAICTISTQSHLFKTQALFASLRGQVDTSFYCLILDGYEEVAPDIAVIGLKDMAQSDTMTSITRYRGDRLRWACKPLLLMHLIDQGYEKVIYVDNDIYFFSGPQFLFEALSTDNIILTPHFYPTSPNKDQHWLEANFRVGLFNAGFIGVNSNGAHVMRWWADCCAYNVKKSAWRGLFDDQKYLDLLPIIFDNVQIIKHKGCNVAGWNLAQCPRSLNKNGALMLDNRWPLIFIHFNGFTLRAILRGKDPLLAPHLAQYVAALKHFKPNYSADDEIGFSGNDILLFIRHVAWKLNRMFE